MPKSSSTRSRESQARSGLSRRLKTATSRRPPSRRARPYSLRRQLMGPRAVLPWGPGGPDRSSSGCDKHVVASFVGFLPFLARPTPADTHFMASQKGRRRRRLAPRPQRLGGRPGGDGGVLPGQDHRAHRRFRSRRHVEPSPGPAACGAPNASKRPQTASPHASFRLLLFARQHRSAASKTPEPLPKGS
jgi:hypothetical protein